MYSCSGLQKGDIIPACQSEDRAGEAELKGQLRQLEETVRDSWNERGIERIRDKKMWRELGFRNR